MARNFRRFPTARGSIRRKTGWNGGPYTGSGANFVATSILLTSAGTYMAGNSVIATEDGLTIVRVRGELLATIDVNAATDEGILAVGLVVASQEASSVGAAAYPDPLSDMDREDWLWHKLIPFVGQFGAAQSATLGTQVTRVEIDSRAMRKLNEGDAVSMVFGWSGVSTQCKVMASTRILAKLP